MDKVLEFSKDIDTSSADALNVQQNCRTSVTSTSEQYTRLTTIDSFRYCFLGLLVLTLNIVKCLWFLRCMTSQILGLGLVGHVLDSITVDDGTDASASTRIFYRIIMSTHTHPANCDRDGIASELFRLLISQLFVTARMLLF